MNGMIHSENLQITFRMPSAIPISQRFDSAAIIEQVVLNKKHQFCVPEQKIKERETCFGAGLCSEYVWDELGKEVMPGCQFPKFGVGLLTQRPEGGSYDMWKYYEVKPFEIHSELSGNRALFIQEPCLCLGIAARIYKEVKAEGNRLTIRTTIHNVGQRILDLQEYQHNFVAIDERPIGPGYQLNLPFDGSIDEIQSAVHCLPNRETPSPGRLESRGQTLYWKQDMNQREYHKVTKEQNILPMAHYEWSLTHTNSPASIKEIVSFAPSKLVLWGVEHCICTEVYVPIKILIGQMQSFSRTWIFED